MGRTAYSLRPRRGVTSSTGGSPRRVARCWPSFGVLAKGCGHSDTAPPARESAAAPESVREMFFGGTHAPVAVPAGSTDAGIATLALTAPVAALSPLRRSFDASART